MPSYFLGEGCKFMASHLQYLQQKLAMVWSAEWVPPTPWVSQGGCMRAELGLMSHAIRNYLTVRFD